MQVATNFDEVIAHVDALSVQVKNFVSETFGTPVHRIKIKKTDKAEVYTNGTCELKGVISYINLNLGKCLTEHCEFFLEYRSYQHSASIGSFTANTWREWADALLLHEMAHAVQFFLKLVNPGARYAKGHENLGAIESGHGDFFKRIYQILRVKFLNDRITDHNFTRVHAKALVERKRAVKAAKPIVTTLKGYTIGQTIKSALSGRTFTITAFKTANTKYPILATTTTGKTFKLALSQIAK